MNVSKGFHYEGPLAPDVLFVVSDDDRFPNHEELIRASAFVNEDGVLFQKRYLEPLGLARPEVGVLWADIQHMHSHFADLVAKIAPRVIVNIGPEPITRERSGVLTVNTRPFSRAGDVWKSSFKEELERKMRGVRKQLDRKPDLNALSIHPLLKAARPRDGEDNATLARIHKALVSKRIVYSVVLDPYQVDLQGDWIPPEDIEDTAHRYVLNDGYVSDRHEQVAKGSRFVESSVEGYPPGEREKAFAGLPHRAFRRKYGNDVVHSGAWILGIQLEQPLWEQFQKGELEAFSIEGFGTRTEISSDEMPEVTFVDLETVG